MNKKNKCFILVGNVGTGKSTAIKKLPKLMNPQGPREIFVFSDDSIYTMIGSSELEGNFYRYSALAYGLVQTQLESFLFFCMGHEVAGIAVDMPNIRRSNRKDIYNKISMKRGKGDGTSKRDCDYEIIVIDLGKDEKGEGLERRNLNNETRRGLTKEHWGQVHHDFLSVYETPDKKKEPYIDEIIYM